MNYKFRIPYDDAVKIIPIFEVFGTKPFTRAKVVAMDGMPQITSGDIVRWECHGIIECLGREIVRPDLIRQPVTSPNMWKLTDRAKYALTKDSRSVTKHKVVQ